MKNHFYWSTKERLQLPNYHHNNLLQLFSSINFFFLYFSLHINTHTLKINVNLCNYKGSPLKLSSRTRPFIRKIQILNE